MSKVCTLCGEKIPTPESCICKQISYSGEVITRIPYGDEEYNWGTLRCSGCGTYRGGFHHENCSREICPMCGELLVVCDCEKEFLI